MTDLPAGRELDALVAERVFGCAVEHQARQAHASIALTHPRGAQPHQAISGSTPGTP